MRERRWVGKSIRNTVSAFFGIEFGKWNGFFLFEKINCGIFGNRKNPSFETFILVEFFEVAPHFHKRILRDILYILSAAYISIHEAVDRLEIAAVENLERFFIAGEIVGYKLLIRTVLIHFFIIQWFPKK